MNKNIQLIADNSSLNNKYSKILGGTNTSNSTHSGYSPDMAFDDDPSSLWASNGSSASLCAKYFSTPQTIDALDFRGLFLDSGGYWGYLNIIEYSGSVWNTITTIYITGYPTVEQSYFLKQRRTAFGWGIQLNGTTNGGNMHARDLRILQLNPKGSIIIN